MQSLTFSLKYKWDYKFLTYNPTYVSQRNRCCATKVRQKPFTITKGGSLYAGMAKRP